MQFGMNIDHFRVTVCLCFKTEAKGNLGVAYCMSSFLVFENLLLLIYSKLHSKSFGYLMY